MDLIQTAEQEPATAEAPAPIVAVPVERPARHFLTAEEILSKAGKLAYEDVPVPELGPGACVRISEMSGEAKDAFEESLLIRDEAGVLQTHTIIVDGEPVEVARQDLANHSAKVVAASAVNANTGERLFTTVEQVVALGRISSSALRRMAAAANRLNKSRAADMAALQGESAAARP